MILATILLVILVHFPQVGKDEEYGKVVLFLEKYIDPWVHVCIYIYIYRHSIYILFWRTSGRVTPLYLHIFAPRAPINVFVGVGATDRATCVLSTELRIRRATKPS